jgi:hypothetical protein
MPASILLQENQNQLFSSNCLKNLKKESKKNFKKKRKEKQLSMHLREINMIILMIEIDSLII